ncbi:hypothetical protein ACIQB5_29745 [Streptomyces sp. NPDC088560]|uniref:hypothetical protein n=1 Tax=Streptomyces sp. NPDC088560 TaxID=3365868 RepID=UPI003805878F
MAHVSPTPDLKAFSVVQAIYLQDPPLWDIEEWVTNKAAEFYSKPLLSRMPNSAAIFRKKALKAAAVEWKKRWESDKDHYTLHLLPAVYVMEDLIQEWVHSDDFPAKWEREETIGRIRGGLELADTVLTPKQRQALHLESLIGANRAKTAQAMNIGEKCAGSHLSSAWRSLEKYAVDLQVMRWFVTSIGGTFTNKSVVPIEEELKRDAARAKSCAGITETEEKESV